MAAVDTSEASAAGIALAEANINWERYARRFPSCSELLRTKTRNLFILAGGLRLRPRIFLSVSGSAARF